MNYFDINSAVDWANEQERRNMAGALLGSGGSVLGGALSLMGGIGTGAPMGGGPGSSKFGDNDRNLASFPNNVFDPNNISW